MSLRLANFQPLKVQALMLLFQDDFFATSKFCIELLIKVTILKTTQNPDFPLHFRSFVSLLQVSTFCLATNCCISEHMQAQLLALLKLSRQPSKIFILQKCAQRLEIFSKVLNAQEPILLSTVKVLKNLLLVIKLKCFSTHLVRHL